LRIQSLWHYPVKSLLGERLQTLDLEEWGAVGDRLFAIADKEGKLGSGKSTRRFTRIDKLLSLRAGASKGAVLITFPDGTSGAIGEKDLDQMLSDFLGQQVALVREKDVPHHDDGAVHLLLSSELARLQALVPDAQIDPRRFRANIVLETPAHIAGADLLGKVLTLGETRLLVTHKTERCRMVTLSQEDLTFDPRVLRAIAQDFDVDFGVYAKVLRPGTLSVGDSVHLSPAGRAQYGLDKLGI